MTLRLRPRLWQLPLVLGVGVTAAYFLVARDSWAQAVIYQGAAIVPVAAIVIGIRIHGRGTMRHWWLLALGIALFAGGDLVWNVYRLLGAQTPFPSAADVLYLLAYPALFAGILSVVRSLGRVRPAEVLDGAVAAAGPALVIWVMFARPMLDTGGISLGERLTGTAYPVMDILLLAGFAQLLVRAGRNTFALNALLAGMGLLLASDVVYSQLRLDNTYVSGMWLDAGWILSYAVWASAALHPSMRRLRSVESEQVVDKLSVARVAVLTCSLCAPFLLLIDESLRHHIVDDISIAIGGILTVACVVARVLLLRRARDRAELLLRASEQRYRALYEDTEESRELLATHNEELQEVDRLKDELIALVSHEFRTPLTSVVGYVELVRSGDAGPLTDEQKQFLDVVGRNADRLLRLVSDLLFVAQVEAGRLSIDHEPVPLDSVVAESVEAAAPLAATRGIDLRVESDEPAGVVGDRARLGQLLDNLVSNALKFTPPLGTVVVRLRRRGDTAVIEVEDTGMGIGPEDQELLFTRFFRTREAVEGAVQGTGLGLSITKAIAEAHGGTIAVRSTLGAGTTFVVELPLAVRALHGREPAGVAA